jgi:hypothetical protein
MIVRIKKPFLESVRNVRTNIFFLQFLINVLYVPRSKIEQQKTNRFKYSPL